MKNVNIITIALLGYLLIMSYIGWPGRNEHMGYTEYFLVIGVTVVIILLLRYLRIRLYKMRNKDKTDKSRPARSLSDSSPAGSSLSDSSPSDVK